MSKDKMYTFTVADGEHQGVKKIYKRGESFQSQYPLDKMFIGKFVRGAEVITVDVKNRTSDTRLTFVFADAEDVTDQFPLASEHELRVFKDSVGGYAVASAQEDINDLMNLAPTVMGSKSQVKKWLTSYVESQERE
jgi:hypothetical protein